MDKLIGLILISVVLTFIAEGFKKNGEATIARQRANKRAYCKKTKDRLCIKTFILNVESTNEKLTYDLIQNTSINLDGKKITRLNLTCVACGVSLTRVAIKRKRKWTLKEIENDAKAKCSWIEYVTENVTGGIYSCEVEKSNYKTVSASVWVKLKRKVKAVESITNLQTKDLGISTISVNTVTSITEVKSGTERHQEKPNATPSSVSFFFLGFLLVTAIITVSIAFIYKRKYRRYRNHLLSVSRRLAELNETCRPRQSQYEEGDYINTSCKTRNAGVIGTVTCDIEEPVYLNTPLGQGKSHRYLSDEGLIYLSLTSLPNVMTPGHKKRSGTRKGKINYSTIDHEKTGNLVIVSKVDEYTDIENDIYQNISGIVRRIN